MQFISRINALEQEEARAAGRAGRAKAAEEELVRKVEEFRSYQEVTVVPALADAMSRGLEKGREEGREEGRAEGWRPA